MNYNGLAKIIPFTPRPQVRVGPPWTTTELGELFRVAHVLRQSGMTIETDMGLSDEGDPWFVFYSVQSEDVIAHFARINGEIVVHGLSSGGVVSGVNLHDVVRQLQPVQTMERQQTSQTDRSVVLHPFMLLVAFVAASFLATEESQAATPVEKTAAKAEAAGDAAAKAKADWIDRAMTLLYSKAKDRGDGGLDLPSSRKMVAGDTLQHSMALVMLAAAISQAQADVFSSEDGRGLDAGPDLKIAPEAHKLVADVAVVDAAGADDLGILTAPQGATAPSQPEDHSYSDTITPLLGVDAVGWNSQTVPTGGVSNALMAPAAPLLVLQADSSVGAPALLSTGQDHVSLPEIVPVVTSTPVANAPAATAGAKPATAVAPTTVTAATSLDITLEGGALQFHQNNVDLRLIDVVATQLDQAEVVDQSGVITLGGPAVVVPAVKNIVLTNAQENVLVETGDTRIKNFDFGVDLLVINDPTLLVKQPDVVFTTAGDIIIQFNETTRVVLLGVFQPSQMVAGVASVDSI